MTLTLAVLANRASACSRPVGMRWAAEKVIPRRRTSSTRSNARTSSGALLRYGPLRNRSSSDWCPLSGIDRRASSLDRVSGDAAAASIDQTRSSTRLRSRATCRSRVVTAGNRTFCAISQVVARSNKTLGRSVPVQQSALMSCSPPVPPFNCPWQFVLSTITSRLSSLDLDLFPLALDGRIMTSWALSMLSGELPSSRMLPAPVLLPLAAVPSITR